MTTFIGAKVRREHGFKGRPDSGLVLRVDGQRILVLVDGLPDCREWWSAAECEAPGIAELWDAGDHRRQRARDAADRWLTRTLAGPVEAA